MDIRLGMDIRGYGHQVFTYIRFSHQGSYLGKLRNTTGLEVIWFRSLVVGVKRLSLNRGMGLHVKSNEGFVEVGNPDIIVSMT